MKNKKGVLDQLQALIIPIIGVGVALAVGFLIFAQAKDQLKSIEGLNSTGGSIANPEGTISWNATSEVVTSMADVPGWLPIIIICVIGVILLSLVHLFKR